MLYCCSRAGAHWLSSAFTGQKMKIFITGGTGFIGRSLCERLARDGHHMTVLTRSASRAKLTLPPQVTTIEGDPTVPGPWQQSLMLHDAVINLAGESILGLWTKGKKERFERSRIDSTRNVVQAIGLADKKPALISASAIGFYGTHPHHQFTEKSASGSDYIASVCRKWEEQARVAEQFGSRVAIVRIGVVLHPTGGALKQMLTPYRFGFGARIGSGQQWMSWIALDDLTAIFSKIISQANARGVFNATAPQPATQATVHETLSSALRRSNPLAIPAFVFKLLLGEASVLLTEGQYVVPARVRELGHSFFFPNINVALAHMLTERPAYELNTSK